MTQILSCVLRYSSQFFASAERALQAFAHTSRQSEIAVVRAALDACASKTFALTQLS